MQDIYVGVVSAGTEYSLSDAMSNGGLYLVPQGTLNNYSIIIIVYSIVYIYSI